MKNTHHHDTVHHAHAHAHHDDHRSIMQQHQQHVYILPSKFALSSTRVRLVCGSDKPFDEAEAEAEAADDDEADDA